MKTESTKIIGEVFQEISDLVTPTMGARGRLAVLRQDLDKPTLTDDGVSVARLALSQEGLRKLPAVSMVEGAAATEKEAYDGTTLTVLLTNEFYKLGLKWTKPKILGGKGMHPQVAADRIKELTERTLRYLDTDDCHAEMFEGYVKQLATITTKIPAIGELCSKAYDKAGKDMNVMIEHDINGLETKVERTDGMTIESGYMSEVMGEFCNQGDSTVFENAAIVLLSEGIMTQTQMAGFLRSIPQGEIPPLVFMITPSFNPESLKIILDTLVPNAQKGMLKFQMVFLNEESTDELYMDIAAYTNGKVQDAALGTSNYTLQYCGHADKITIGQKRTIIQNTKTPEIKALVDERTRIYNDLLKNHRHELGINREASIRRRLSNISNGITRIKLAVPTVTEYMTIKLKLDDAIGAVRKAFNDGLVVGGGATLAYISGFKDMKDFKPALLAPIKKILRNAGIEGKTFRDAVRNAVDHRMSFDVVKKTNTTFYDSYASVATSVRNAGSIAENYIRAFIVVG